MTFRTLISLLTGIWIVGNCFSSCKSKPNNENMSIAYTKSDSLWLQFAQAMEQKDISYLNQHSLDSIECAECNCAKTDNDFLNANFAFTHCLDKLMHLERLTDKEFVTTENGSDELQVIYSVKAPMAEEGAYNLIFQFERKGKTYFFKGMLVT